MKIPKSRTVALISGGYLLSAVAAILPLWREGSSHHGNVFEWFIAVILTLPLSIIVSFLYSLIFPNAHYFNSDIGALAAGALFNTGLTYLVVTFVQRLWQRAGMAAPRQLDAAASRERRHLRPRNMPAIVYLCLVALAFLLGAAAGFGGKGALLSLLLTLPWSLSLVGLLAQSSALAPLFLIPFAGLNLFFLHKISGSLFLGRSSEYCSGERWAGAF